MFLSCAAGGKPKETPKEEIKEEKQTGGAVSLNAALEEFSAYIAGRLPSSALTVVAAANVPVKQLGDYIIDELSGSLLNCRAGKF